MEARKKLAKTSSKASESFEESLGRWLAEEVVNPLVRRIKALEERPELTFGGRWKDGESYPEKCLTQYQGGLWLSKMPNNSTRPGSESPAWRLVVKRGAAG
jgi:hypothetical protein